MKNHKTTMIKEQSQYDFHAIANIYPLAKEEEFELLKESIKERGQLSPILILDNKIIDGRNRYLACRDLSIEPRVEIFTGTEDEALKYTIELNSGRRHMDKGQSAMMAANYVLKSRMGAGKKVSVATASKMFLVSEKYIDRAKTIIGKDKSIADKVLEGKLTISQAENKIYQIEHHEREVDILKHGTENSEDSFSPLESRRYIEIQSLNEKEAKRRLLDCEKSKTFNS